MRLLCDEERIPQQGAMLLGTLEQAAVLCLKEEGIPDERVEISLSFVSMEEIHQLNKMYRQVDRHTDVLSFPMIEDFNEIDWEDEEEEILLGDVVICLEQAQKQAEEYGHSQMREIVYLFVHSVLHLLGYDHMEESDKVQMRQQEELIMDALDLKRSV